MTILLLHPLLLPTPQCWDCRCGVLCLACVHFLPCVLLFLILCFLLLDICGWLLYLPISFLFSLQTVSLYPWRESGTWCTDQAGLRLTRNPPASWFKVCTTMCTSFLFLSAPHPYACQTCVKCWASYMLGKQFLTRLHSWPLLSSFIHPLLWSWLLNSLGPRVFLSRHFTLSFISSAFNLSCSVLPC